MKISKAIIAAALSAMLLVSSCPQVCAYNYTDVDRASAKAYSARYERAGMIPDGFNFSKGVCFKNEHGVSCFNGKWIDDKGIPLYIEEADGFLTYYSFGDSYNYSDYCSRYKEKKLSDEQLRKLAEKYFRQYNPTLPGTYTAEYIEPYYDDYGFYSYSMTRIVNGIPLTESSGTVCVDSRTGRLCSCAYTNIVNVPDKDFPKADNILSPLECGLAYYDDECLELGLWYEIDMTDGTAVPYYNLESVNTETYDAVSGEEADEYYSYWGYYCSYYYDETENDDDEDYGCDDDYEDYDHYDDEPVYFRPLSFYGESTELKENYISPAKLMKKVKAEKSISLPEAGKWTVYEKKAGKFCYEYGKETEIVYYRYKAETDPDIKLDVIAEAYSGRIIEYSHSYSYGAEKLTSEEKEAAAWDALKHYSGSAAKEYKIDRTGDDTFFFDRYVNDIPVWGNGIVICIDSDGNAVKFGSWLSGDEKKMPDKGIEYLTGDIISEREAAAAFLEKYPPSLRYLAVTDDNGQVSIRLVYPFDFNYFGDGVRSSEINALTGEVVSVTE